MTTSEIRELLAIANNVPIEVNGEWWIDDQLSPTEVAIRKRDDHSNEVAFEARNFFGERSGVDGVYPEDTAVAKFITTFNPTMVWDILDDLLDLRLYVNQLNSGED